jgi:hypothetical protein
VDRTQRESIWLRVADFTNVLIKPYDIESFEAPGVVVHIPKTAAIAAHLILVVVVIFFDGCVFDRTVHALAPAAR